MEKENNQGKGMSYYINKLIEKNIDENKGKPEIFIDYAGKNSGFCVNGKH